MSADNTAITVLDPIFTKFEPQLTLQLPEEKKDFWAEQPEVLHLYVRQSIAMQKQKFSKKPERYLCRLKLSTPYDKCIIRI